MNAILAPRQNLSQADLRRFNDWLRYLVITNTKKQNIQILFQYFFDKFAHYPETFYSFVEFFKSELIENTDEEIQRNLAQKFLDVLSPLCERFNFFEERMFLTDLSFKILEPETYEQIKQHMAIYEKKSHKIINEIIEKLDNLLSKKNYDYELVGRYKNVYSVYKKIGNDYSKALNLNDIFGFRIILNNDSAADCFNVLNLLHDTFYPIPDMFKDYITIPKINGYQSLHTGLTEIIEHLDLPVEIQIRTREMHEFAENGLAAHWIYAENKKSRLITKKEAQLLHYLSCIAHSPGNDKGVMCFSEGGDIIKMPKHSTALDFAYQIHTDLGNKIKSVQINGEEKNFYYQIKEGDQVKIIQAETEQVQTKWLKYAHTRYAHKKIFEYLKQYAKQET